MCKLTLKTPSVCNIIYKQDSHSPSIVCSGDGSESFLSSSIPNLKFHSLSIQLYGPDLEIYSDSGDKRGRKAVFAESKKTTRLSDAGISDQ